MLLLFCFLMKDRGDNMAIVITNGTYYITTNKNGAIIKTPILEDAQHFYNVNVASRKIQKAPGKCKGYYVFDTDGDDKLATGRKNRKKKERRKYGKDTRKMLYKKADGRCVLCGREILLKDISIDHIVPLSMGGADSVENLQCTCAECNRFKANILPSDFMERISTIFFYQMERKYVNRWRWKVIHKILERMI